MTTEKPFEVIDATPPPDLPKLLLVMDDTDFSRRNPGKGFYVRIALDDRNVDIANIDDCYTLPDAVKKANKMGHEVQHWMRVSTSMVSLIPKAIQPRKD
ncbi:MAG: hypothetical protein RSG77_21805 [Hafnia sp.]